MCDDGVLDLTMKRRMKAKVKKIRELTETVALLKKALREAKKENRDV